MRYFIVTIDTEGDDLWHWKAGDRITTENVRYLQRFQDLCQNFGFKPVWLSNWEMINDIRFVHFIDQNLSKKNCELGMHLHAWNTPPFYDLPRTDNSGAPYLVEYPGDIMEQKIKAITEKMVEQFGFIPASHRAGRWAINEVYFSLLHQYGYEIDCSVTPGMDWSNAIGQTPGFSGPDYKKDSNKIKKVSGVIEIPMVSLFTHRLFISPGKPIKENIKEIGRFIHGKRIWLRPDGRNLAEMLWLAEQGTKKENNYIMFMLHSSELMPGGSPTFPDNGSIETLYSHLGILFRQIARNYKGITLEDYRRSLKNI